MLSKTTTLVNDEMLDIDTSHEVITNQAANNNFDPNTKQ